MTMKFNVNEGDFPLLVIRKRGPLNIPFIVRMAKNYEHFLYLLQKVYSKRAIERIAERTKSQSKSNFWFLYRRCVITGTLCKRVISQNLRNESNEKLNQCITKPYQNTFTTEAMMYGVENEKNGLELCFKAFSMTHKNAKLKSLGLVLHKKYPFIGGSVDGLLICDCCAKPYLIEVKCPFRLKDTGIENWTILEYLDQNQKLKMSHTYYNQINLYQGILEIDTAFFVVYAKNKIFTQLINFDKNFFDNQIQNISEYYCKYYLPTVLGKKI